MSDELLAEIENLVVNYIEASTQYRPTREDFSKPLNTFGLTSVQGMLLVGEIEDTYSIDVPHDLLLGNDSIAAFSQRVYECVIG